MRTLRFLVQGQKIRPDPLCDFSGLVPGSQGYLKAEFIFDEHWAGCKKCASFFRMGGMEDAKPIVNNCCMIPDAVLDRKLFHVSVTGKRSGYVITTNRITVKQGG